ncbi:MAG: acetyl-CoA C-acetyltransferase [Actinomycetota bacterium]|nr:acetyl-CoA C-acetyltransferase [Actinomycetota bacterium]MDH5314709.1 acetyl-CoA C-acetyltransferase [Actinomycetota bacterium]
MTTSVIVAGARTPIGRFNGALAGLRAGDLGAIAIREALSRAGVAAEQVEYTIMGHVLQAGQGQITARQAAIAAGIPLEVPAITINKVCLSGTSAVAMADQMIRAGEIEVAVAGGMESMTNAPFVLPKARAGARLGDTPMLDSMIHDGLWCAFDDRHMGEGTDAINAELGISREEQDAWAVRSHLRASLAWDEGRLAEEVVAVEVPQRKGDAVRFDRDEGIRSDSTLEDLAALRPAFTDAGSITAGNASQISDGGSAVVVMSEQRSEELGLEPIAEIVAFGMSADRYASLQTVPALALEKALKKAGAAASDLGVVEINEAFAAVALHAARMIGLDEAVVNVNGGAVALGHPIGASGARLVLTAAMEMRRRGTDLGAVAICGGGGQGDALVLRRR